MSLKTIDQTGIKNLIAERIKNPELYVNKPLVIWRADIADGIQERILEEAFDEWNKGKTTEERKWFRTTMLGMGTPQVYNLTEDTIVRDDVNGSLYGAYRFGLLVIDPMFVHGDYMSNPESLKMYHSIINNRKWGDIEILAGVPIVSFMPYTYDWFQTPDAYPAAEQYVFKPDFEEWADWFVHKKGAPVWFIDFIRGNGSEDDIAYRWYNCFVNRDNGINTKESGDNGCCYPNKWKEMLIRLKMGLEEEGVERISELSDFIDIDVIAGISSDIKEEFKQYVKSHNL